MCSFHTVHNEYIRFPGDIFVLINILSDRSEGGLDHAGCFLMAGKVSADQDAELRIGPLFAAELPHCNNTH